MAKISLTGWLNRWRKSGTPPGDASRPDFDICLAGYAAIARREMRKKGFDGDVILIFKGLEIDLEAREAQEGLVYASSIPSKVLLLMLLRDVADQIEARLLESVDSETESPSRDKDRKGVDCAED